MIKADYWGEEGVQNSQKKYDVICERSRIKREIMYISIVTFNQKHIYVGNTQFLKVSLFSRRLVSF